MGNPEPLCLVVTEEIALEGLEGITLEGLWFRISQRLKIPLPFNDYFKEQIWSYVKSQNVFEFFEIPENRRSLSIITREEYFYTEDYDSIKPKLDDFYYIYKFFPVKENPLVKGSCEHFDTRIKIPTEDLSLLTAIQTEEKYERKLVIVACQQLRNSLLMPTTLNSDMEYNVLAYCLLERIGRSREFGEMTSGKYSLNDFVKDSSLLHYHRNNLLKYKLIIKQPFQQRINNVQVTGSILHLPRFIKVYRHKNTFLVEKTINYLKTRPDCMADYDDIRNSIGISGKSMCKLFKNNDLQGIVELEIKVPYRKMYPNAKPEEYFLKGRSIEKTLKSIKLLKPEINTYDIWYKEEHDEKADESGFLDNSRELINVPILKQAYELIKESGNMGLTQAELGKLMGLSKLNSRSVIRGLERTKNITSFNKDEGRQRVCKYILPTFSKHSEQEMNCEIDKLLKNAPSLERPLEPIPGTSKETTFLITTEDTKNSQVVQIVEPTEPVPLTDLHDVDINIEIYEKSSFIDNIENVKVSMKFHRRIPDTKKDHGIHWYVLNNKLTKKMLHRMNFVLDEIKKQKIIGLLALLQLVIKMEEEEQDSAEKICRKSLSRLLNRLAIDRFINVVELHLESDSQQVNVVYFSDTSVSAEHENWVHIIEEEKLKNFVMSGKKTTEVPVIKSENPIVDENSLKSDVCPKFIKMKIFHELLHYLIYSYPETIEKIPIEEALKEWKEEHKNRNFDDIETKITCVYSKEISWKMFIPPLPQHQGYKTGWGFLRDIIHRIPLVLFVKLVQLNTTMPQILYDYLAHPIKCNYLLHFLPLEIRNYLMAKRKYVFSIEELCKRLCFAGLMQFGFQKSKSKEEVFIYLNKNAQLWDTTSSEPGYMEITKKEYPRLFYHFDSEKPVKEYWNDMFTICTQTKLNKRSTAIGKELLIEALASKPEMQKTLELRTPETAPLFDIGEIPGDHLGAAGLDKNFHSHLKKSWSRNVGKVVEKTSERKKSLAKKMSVAKKVQKKYQSLVKTLLPKKKIIRKVNAVKQTVKKKVTYDAVDHEALKLMKTLRVTWSQVEDDSLIMCKVALQYAFATQNQISHFVNCALFRDILHWRYKHSLNKTSRACQRRLLYITKHNPVVKQKLNLYLGELRSNKEFAKQYGPKFVEKLKKFYKNNYAKFTIALRIHLVQMIYHIHQIFFKFESNNETLEDVETIFLPNDYKLFHECYEVMNPQCNLELKYKNPNTTDELNSTLLASLIHGTMCSIKDKTNYTLQLFDIYKNYNDGNLTQAVANLRANRIISTNKLCQKPQPTTNMKILPFNFSQYHLSVMYSNQLFISNLHFSMYTEYFHNTVGLSNIDLAVTNESQISSTDCGMIYMLCDFIQAGTIKLHYKMPEKIVSLQPSMQKSVPNFDQLTRFQEIMKFKEKIQLRKSQKGVSFNTNDDQYLHDELPFEFFQKIDLGYWHILCIFQKFIANRKWTFKELHINHETNECNLDACILKSLENFNANCIRIADKAKDQIVAMLIEPSRALLDYAQKVMENCKKLQQKDVGKKQPKKLEVQQILEAILGFANSELTENSSWITDYNRTFLNEDDILDADTGINMNNTVEEKKDDDMLIKRLSKQLKGTNEYEKKCSLNDLYVVNFSNFCVEIPNANDGKATFDNQSVISSFVPFGVEFRDGLLKKIRDDSLWEEKEPSDEKLGEILAELKVTNLFRDHVFAVLNFILEAKELGVTADNLLEFNPNKFLMQKILEILIENHFVLRTGFEKMVFVHWKFASFWLIKTYHLLRSERDAIDSTAKDKESVKRKATEEPTEATEPKRMRVEDSENPETARETSRQEALREKRQKEEEEEIAKNRVHIQIRPCPWIRINGSLNRRVIDRWLSAILSYIATNPGVPLLEIYQRFNVISPFDLRYLLEILCSIQSIKLMAFYNNTEYSLFSEIQTTEISEATFFDSDESTFVELCDNAMQKLSFFIGLKKYKTEFI